MSQIQNISVLVLSYSHPEYLLKCVSQFTGISYISEVLIYDNNSWVDMQPVYDEISQKLAGSSISCVIKSVSVDTSLAVAYNWGLDTASAPLLLCINTDVFIQNPDCLRESIACFDDEKTMVVGHICESATGEMCGIEPYYFSKTDCRGHFDGFLRRYSKSIIQSNNAFPVETVSHRSVMLRKGSIRFDESLWYRYDMLDFCLRVHAANGTVFINPNLQCLHLDQGDRSRRNYASIEWQKRVLKSNFYMLEKHKDLNLRKMSRKYVLFDIQDRQILDALKRDFLPPRAIYFAVFIAVVSGVAWGVVSGVLIAAFFTLYFFMMWFSVLYQSKRQLEKCGYLNLSAVTALDVLRVAWVSFTKESTQTRKYIKKQILKIGDI